MLEPTISIPVSYQREWQDGFGARGWKLDVSIGEPSVIAATVDHGTRILTSVLVHDILDHHLCGFGIGGHRNEAMALIQLASRTGADPRLDYGQIVDEDLMKGNCSGEPLRSFLPDDLACLVPNAISDDKAIVEFLCGRIGKISLRERLVNLFVDIGESVQRQVETHWRSMGLDYQRRSAMGMALQRLLVQVDALARRRDWEQAHCRFSVGNHSCAVTMVSPINSHFTANVVDYPESLNSMFSL